MPKAKKVKPSINPSLLIVGLLLAVALIFAYYQTNTVPSQASLETGSYSEALKCWEAFDQTEYSQLLKQLGVLLTERDYWFAILRDPNSSDQDKRNARLQLWILELKIQDITKRMGEVKDKAYADLEECLRKARDAAGVELPA